MIPQSTPNPGRSRLPRPRARNPSTSTPATKAITACLGFFRESGRRKGPRPRSQDRSEKTTMIIMLGPVNTRRKMATGSEDKINKVASYAWANCFVFALLFVCSAFGQSTITATQGANGGTITPGGTVTVTNGANQTFTIQPNSG